MCCILVTFFNDLMVFGSNNFIISTTDWSTKGLELWPLPRREGLNHPRFEY
jgi:hypothetical protein